MHFNEKYIKISKLPRNVVFTDTYANAEFKRADLKLNVVIPSVNYNRLRYICPYVCYPMLRLELKI